MHDVRVIHIGSRNGPWGQWLVGGLVGKYEACVLLTPSKENKNEFLIIFFLTMLNVIWGCLLRHYLETFEVYEDDSL